MVGEILAESAALYRKGAFAEKTTFYFSIDETKKTLMVDGGCCTVIDGKGMTDADCVYKMGKELFLKIWKEGYKPGMRDFMSGAIKSNAPNLLQKFMAAIGK